MDKDEFKAWMGRHQTAFPALSDWLASLPDAAKGTLELWFDAMAALDAGAAREATSRMVAGKEPLVEFANWHDTPRFVAKHCAELKLEASTRRASAMRRVDGEPTFRCRECWDTGIVEIFYSKDVRDVRAGTFDRAFVYRTATACTCEAAQQQYRGVMESGGLRMFDATRDVAIPHGRPCCTRASLVDDMNLILQTDPVDVVSIDDWARAH